MKFVCDNCQAKYTIADAKVAGKVLKIRCKSCNHVIEIRDPQLATPPSAARPDPAPAPTGSLLESKFASSFSKGDTAAKTPVIAKAVQRSAAVLEQKKTAIVQWFAAIGGRPTGPVSAEDLRDFKAAGRIDNDTLVWREGLPEWVRLRNCQELVGLIAVAELAAAPPPPAALPKPPVPTRPSSPSLPGLDALKGASLGAADRGSTPDPTSEPAAVAPSRTAAQNPAVATSDTLDDAFFTTDEPAAVARVTPMTPPRPAGHGRTRTFAISFFVSCLAVGLTSLGFVVFQQQREVTKIVRETETVTVEKIVYRDREAASLPEVATAEPSNRQPARRAPGTGGEPGKREPDERTKQLLQQLGAGGAVDDAAPLTLPSAKSGPDAAGGGASGNGLSQSELQRVVTANKSSLRVCYERALRQDEAPSSRDLKVPYTIVIGPSGMVKSATATGEVTGYPSLKQCIESTVRKWAFPSSAAQSTVEASILFTPK